MATAFSVPSRTLSDVSQSSANTPGQPASAKGYERQRVVLAVIGLRLAAIETARLHCGRVKLTTR